MQLDVPPVGGGHSELRQHWVIGMHTPLHSLKPGLHTTPQLVPLHVALAFGGGAGHGVQRVPHEAGLWSSRHMPEQSW